MLERIMEENTSTSASSGQVVNAKRKRSVISATPQKRTNGAIFNGTDSDKDADDFQNISDDSNQSVITIHFSKFLRL